jgi:hypothetical protein
MPEPEESLPLTPTGGRLANCGLLNQNAAGGMAPQPVGESSVNLASVRRKKSGNAATSYLRKPFPRRVCYSLKLRRLSLMKAVPEADSKQ